MPPRKSSSRATWRAFWAWPRRSAASKSVGARRGGGCASRSKRFWARAAKASRPRLRRVGRHDAARAVGRPRQLVDAHLPDLHLGVPRVVDEVVGPAVRPLDDGVVAGAAHLAGDALEDARLAPLAAVRPHDAVGDDVVNAVVGRLIVRAAVEAVIAAAVFADEGALDRKSTRLNFSHANISYAVFCLKNKNHEL